MDLKFIVIKREIKRLPLNAVCCLGLEVNVRRDLRRLEIHNRWDYGDIPGHAIVSEA